MSKSVKIWLIVATLLVFVGLIIFGCVMSVLEWNFSRLSTDKYETNTHVISEMYESVSIIADNADVIFARSEGGNTTVVCYEQQNLKHAVSVEENTLTIKTVNTKKWYEYIGISFGSPKITVYLPQGEYGSLYIKESTGDVEIPNHFKFERIDITASTGDVKNFAVALGDIKIKTSTGAIHVEDISATSVELSVSTGKVSASGVACSGDFTVNVSTGKSELTDITCKNLISTGNTGSVSLKKVISEEMLSIKRSTGDVKFNGCDAGEIFVETDTGDVTGTLLTSKVFITRTDTGKVNVPKSLSGGKCEIETDTGDIKISVGK